MKTIKISVMKDGKAVSEVEKEFNQWLKAHVRAGLPYVFELDDGFSVEVLIR